MFEDSYLDSYWESQPEPYYGEDYNLWEEERVFQDQQYENLSGEGAEYAHDGHDDWDYEDEDEYDG